jgi:hypothetical protein
MKTLHHYLLTFSAVSVVLLPSLSIAEDGSALEDRVKQLEKRLEQSDDAVKKLAAKLAVMEKEKGAASRKQVTASGAKGAAAKGSDTAVASVAEPPTPNPGQMATLKTVSQAFDVPNSPAAAVLGMSQDNIQHLKTPQELIPALINGLDDRGHFQSGLSVDFAPYQAFRGGQRTEDLRYHEGEGAEKALSVWFQRILVRTQISLATIKGTTDADMSSKIAMGVHSVIANSDEPIDGVRTNPDEASGGIPKLDYFGRMLNEYVKSIEDRIKAGDLPFTERQEFLSNVGNFLYNYASLAVGAAPEWIAQNDASRYEYAGTAVWSSFALIPPKKYPVRFVFDAMYHQGDKIAATDAVDPPAATSSGQTPKEVTENSLILTGGIRFGTRDLNATATASYLHEDEHQNGADRGFRYALTLETRVSNTNSWLTFSLSKDEGHTDGKNPVLVLGGIKLGLGGQDMSSKDQ